MLFHYRHLRQISPNSGYGKTGATPDITFQKSQGFIPLSHTFIDDYEIIYREWPIRNLSKLQKY